MKKVVFVLGILLTFSILPHIVIAEEEPSKLTSVSVDFNDWENKGCSENEPFPTEEFGMTPYTEEAMASLENKCYIPYVPGENVFYKYEKEGCPLFGSPILDDECIQYPYGKFPYKNICFGVRFSGTRVYLGGVGSFQSSLEATSYGNDFWIGRDTNYWEADGVNLCDGPSSPNALGYVDTGIITMDVEGSKVEIKSAVESCAHASGRIGTAKITLNFDKDVSSEGGTTKSAGSIDSVSLTHDKTKLNKFINSASYDESISLEVKETIIENLYDKESFKIITEDDQLICEAIINIPSAAIITNYEPNEDPMMPPTYTYTYDTDYLSKINVAIDFLDSDSGIDEDYSPKERVLVPLSECEIVEDQARVICKEPFSGVEGKAYKCSATIKKEPKFCEKEVISPQQFIVAKYIYYLVPVNQDSYGNIGTQYSYYAGLSDVNDRGKITETVGKWVGKKIPTKRINVDLDKECCFSLLSETKKKYFWTLKGECVGTKNWGLKASDDKCQPDPAMTDEQNKAIFNKYFSTAMKRIKDEFNKKGLNLPNAGSKVAFILNGNTISQICHRKTSNLGLGCNWNKDLFLSTNPPTQTLAHELGHSIGNANDEYDLTTWEIQTKIDGHVNPVGENKEVHFPECCLTPYGANAGCGNKEACYGMPYRYSLDEALDDYPVDKSTSSGMDAFSVMGPNGLPSSLSTLKVYPQNLICPLRNCYECPGGARVC